MIEAMQPFQDENMKIRISIEEASRIVESAFIPLNCIAKDSDYGDKLRIRILNTEGEPMIRNSILTRAQWSNRERLGSIILQLRGALNADGCNLTPWALPKS